MSDNIKQELDTLWIKYQKTLEMLDQTLDELEQKPKEIQIPITEYVEVPKIVEVEIVKDISQDTRDSYELQIADLKEQLQTMQTATQQRDYWGHPKKTSNKIVDDVSYEQQTERRYQRLVQEVKAGSLDINNLTHQEQQVVRKLLNE
jgi:hypothetical protein|tara:strand:+ start:45 stop:485 length:441 start_codon:yes stop_codon:yes gene_type:complete